MINISIDGVQVDAQRPFEYSIDGTEEYDKGEFQIINTTRKKAYPDYALVEIGNKRFILESDYPVRTGKNKYTHKITITEEVKLLEKTIVPDRKFTTINGLQVTWLYMLRTLLTKVDGTFLYTIDAETEVLLDKTGDFTEFVGGTLLDHVVKIMRAVKAVPTLTNGVIGHTLTGVRQNSIATALQQAIDNDELLGRQTFSNIEDYGSKVYTKSKNATYERDDDVYSVFPYEGGFVTPRSSDNKYEDSLAQLECDSDIRVINKVLHKLFVSWRATNKGNFGSTGDVPVIGSNGDEWFCDTDGYYSANANLTFDSDEKAVWLYGKWYKAQDNLGSLEIIIDATDYFYKKNDWNKLEIETDNAIMELDFYQNNTFFYQNSIISNLGVNYPVKIVGVAFDRTAYEGFLTSILDNSSQGTEDIIFNGGSISNYNLRDTLWNWEYIAKRDVDFIQDRAKSDIVTKNITIYNQQSDSEVELSRLGESSFSKVNRIGNDKYQITVRVDDILDAESIGNYDSDDYAISGIKYLIRWNTIDVTYEFVKNLSPLIINEAVSNNRERFTITDRQVKTNFIKHYALELGYTQEADLTDLPITFRQKWLNGYSYESSQDTPVKTAVYEYGSASEQYIGMTVKPAVTGNSILFHSQFQSGTVAGAKLVETGFADLANKRVNVSYTNINGEVNEYKIYYGNTVTSTPDDWPKVTGFNTFFGDFTRDSNLNPDEILQETIVFDAKTASEDLLIYSSFSQKNSLIKKLNSGLTLTAYIYLDTTAKKYTQNSKGVIAGYDSTATVTVTKTTGLLTINTSANLFSFAIADSDGDLHIVQKRRLLTNQLYFNVKEGGNI